MNHGDHSFSLFETMIAIGMLAVVMLQVTSIQGQVVYSLEYGQNLSRGVWLAKGIMAKLEYEWATRSFSELELNLVDQLINDSLWGEEAAKIYRDFSYNITSQEWKLPILSFLTGDNSAALSADDGSSSLIAEQLKAIFGDHVMKIATVEVFWPEGARRASTTLSMLLVNQQALDGQILTMKSPGAEPTTELKDQFAPNTSKTTSQPDGSKPQNSPKTSAQPPASSNSAETSRPPTRSSSSQPDDDN